jgi:hypothetical protein
VRRKIEQQFSQVEAKEPPRADLEGTYRALLAAYERAGGLESVSRRDLRLAPWVIFSPWEGGGPLAERQGFLRAFLAAVRARLSNRLVLSLVQAYLRFYPRWLTDYELLRAAVARLLAACDSPRCRRIKNCDGRVGLFTPDAHARLWRILGDSQTAPGKLLEELCLGGALARQGLSAAAFGVGCREVERELTSGRATAAFLERMFHLAVDPHGVARPLRFAEPEQRVGLANAVLSPFATGRPSAELATLCKEFVLTHYGDPRLDRARWQGVSDAALQVMYGWLVTETLEDFFRLLEYVARNDETARRHWRYRRAFWSAYLKRGVIRDAWVVLSPQIDHQARQSLRLRPEAQAYGRLDPGAGVLGNHSALVLRVDRLVITEWSHSGKYRVWDEGLVRGADVPRLYLRRYARTDLIRDPHHEGTHHGSESGRWQERLSSYIRERTGISVNLRELMPRD